MERPNTNDKDQKFAEKTVCGNPSGKRRKTFYEAIFKRPIDFVCALVLLAVLSPILLVVAILSRIILGRQIIYKQKRVGKGRKVFWFYKFRSMTHKRGADGKILPYGEGLGKYGKFLRKTSLDELPQLWNILKGDMSFIGPRPRDVRECVFLSEQQCERFAVRPGISGLAQVNGRNDISFDKVAEYDARYVRKVGFWGDVGILTKTFLVVFRRKGTESTVKAKNVIEYYGDSLLRNGKVTQVEYDARIDFAKTLAAGDRLTLIDLRAVDTLSADAAAALHEGIQNLDEKEVAEEAV